MLPMFGPGRSCPSASVSTNSRWVSQPFRSTSVRCAQGSTPPNPDSASCENARKSSSGPMFRVSGSEVSSIGGWGRDMGGSVVSAMRLHYRSPQARSQSATENRHARELSFEGDGCGRGFGSTTCFSRAKGRDGACRHKGIRLYHLVRAAPTLTRRSRSTGGRSPIVHVAAYLFMGASDGQMAQEIHDALCA